MPNYYIDPVLGNDANNGSLGSPWKTITSGATEARIAPGDEIRVKKSASPATFGFNATWGYSSSTVSLSGTPIKHIDTCESTWSTAGISNVTVTLDTSNEVEGSGCCKLVLASAFTTGKIAFHSLGTATDFSSFSKISFLAKDNLDVAAGVLQIKLCSDFAGNTPVNTFNLPAINYSPIIALTHLWHRIVVDNGGALGSTIRSIALYAVSDPGALTIYLDNFIAANNIHHLSLIGQDSAGPVWYPIYYFSGTSIILYYDFFGDPGTMAAWVIYDWYMFDNPVDYRSNINSLNKKGTSFALITYRGGWNFSTDEQDGYTHFAVQNEYGTMFIAAVGIAYNALENFRVFGSYRSFYLQGNHIDVKNIESYAHYTKSAFGISGTQGGVLEGIIVDYSIYSGNFSYNSVVGTPPPRDNTATIYCLCVSSSSRQVLISGTGSVFFIGDIIWYGSSLNILMQTGAGTSIWFRKIISYGDGASLIEQCGFVHVERIELYNARGGKINYLFDEYESDGSCDYIVDEIWAEEGTNLLGSGSSGVFTSLFPIIPINNNRGPLSTFFCKCLFEIPGRWIYANEMGTISDQITAGYDESWARSGSGYCMVIDPKSTSNIGYSKIITFYVESGKEYTISFYVKKSSSAANPVLGYQIYGSGITRVVNDLAVTLTDSWALHTSDSFTPSRDGEVCLYFQAKDGSITGNIGIDDISLNEI